MRRGLRVPEHPLRSLGSGHPGGQFLSRAARCLPVPGHLCGQVLIPRRCQGPRSALVQRGSLTRQQAAGDRLGQQRMPEPTRTPGGVLSQQPEAASSRNPSRTVSASSLVTAPSRSSSRGRPATASPAKTVWASPAQRAARAASNSASRPGSPAGTPSRAPAAPTSAAATSCSVKKGFPSALAYTSSTTPGGTGPPASAAT